MRGYPSESTPGGGGGGLPYKRDGGARRIFLKVTPKRYQDLVLWAWPQVNFNPKRYQNKT